MMGMRSFQAGSPFKKVVVHLDRGCIEDTLFLVHLEGRKRQNVAWAEVGGAVCMVSAVLAAEGCCRRFGMLFTSDR